MEVESDDDFQPAIIRRKRLSRENTQQSGSQKKLKGKGKEIEADNNPMLNTTTEFSGDDFQPSVVKTPELGEPSTSVIHTIDSAIDTTGSSTKTSKRVITIKSTTKNIWKSDYLQPLYDLVRTTNLLVTHTFSFTKYIFLQELTSNENFALNDFITKDFFVEVFLSLVQVKAGNSERLKDTTKSYRLLISKYKETYSEITGYNTIRLSHAQQIALYESTKIQTAYQNNLKAHFGNRLRALINKLFHKKEKAERIETDMKARKCSTDEIKKAIRKEVYQPCNEVKLEISKKELPESSLLDDQARIQLNDFLSSYATDHTFQKQSIFYDVVANPGKHYKAFYKLAELSENNQVKPFACFPLRTSFIPSYMTLDAKIINYHILKNKKVLKMENKFEAWGRVVNLEKKAFKQQGIEKSLRFQGTLETDGVGVSIIKQNTETNRKSPTTKIQVDDNKTKHIEELNRAELNSTVGRCVLIDPGRRDIMYCMKESSTVEEKQNLIYTKNNRLKCSRHFKQLRKHNQPSVVREAELTLSRFKSKTVNLKNFIEYAKARASVQNTLYDYYGNETRVPTTRYFPQSEFDFHVDQRGNLYYGNLFVVRICGFFPQPEFESDEVSIKPQTYVNYLQTMLKQKHISDRLDDRMKNEVQRLARMMYERPQEKSYKVTITAILERLQLLPFRKLKFSSRLHYEQSEQKLVYDLKEKFGNDAILVFGDWSAPHSKNQEPTVNKGLIKMLKKNGFSVYLINEFKTSSYCPKCESELEQFKNVRNPRPYQRNKRPTVLCHGLLRCKNFSCLEPHTTESKRRLWNRDQVAVLNFLKILKSLRHTQKRPRLFSRKDSKTKQQQSFAGVIASAI